MFPNSVDRANVKDPLTFAHFCQQSLGIPNSAVEHRILKKKINEFFATHPQTDWGTLLRIVDWCRAKRRRPAHIYTLINLYRFAYADGFMGDQDPRLKDDPNTDLDIYEILEHETDPFWRRKLICTVGVESRRKVLAEWRREHTSLHCQ